MLGRFALVLSLLIATAAHAERYRAPRTAFGAPDLQGTWDNDSMTSLQRPKGFAALVATPYEAAAYEAKGYARHDQKVGPVDPNAPAPELDKVTDDYARVDPPRGLDRIRGEIRSSQITDPADGRLPYRPEARAAAEKALKDEEVYDHPEGRPFDERCLLGGGGGVAAPMTNRDHVKIIQTRDHVVLLGEMNHEARIVRMGGRRLPPSVRPWMGDSVGRWEGDTLVVETTNLSPQDGWRWNSGEWIRLSPGARIVERFTRAAPGEILYGFTVEDPAVYTQPWRGEATFRATRAAIFEFACHEGNYALPNILAGGRAEDRRKAGATQAGNAP